jgi:hypothetical protein
MYSEDLKKKYNQTEFKNRLQNYLKQYSDDHDMFFIVGFIPRNGEHFRNYLLNVNVQFPGTINLQNGIPCSVVLVPKEGNMLYLLPVMEYSEIHLLNNDFVKVKSSKVIRTQMYSEHLDSFRDFL